MVEIYLINTLPRDLTGEELKALLDKSVGGDSRTASTAVLFRYLPGKPKAESAVADEQFNAGKGELTVERTDTGVRVQPLRMAGLAILRAKVSFDVDDDSSRFSRGAKGTEAIFDLRGPEAGCFTR